MTKNNDLISRNALLELAHNRVGGKIDCNDIARFPAMGAKPVRHGRWIDDHTEIVCSECKAVYSDEIVFMNKDMEFADPPYCPNCGAKLDSRSDEEDVLE